jgi:hypothetical protein
MMLTLNIELPEPLTHKAQVSGFSKQQLQTLIIQFIETFLGLRNFSPDGAIPSEIALDLIQLECLDNDDLWQAAKTKVPYSYTEQMQQLLDKRALTTEEQALVGQLSKLAQRTMLVRAKATVLLKQRGFDITLLQETRHE